MSESFEQQLKSSAENGGIAAQLISLSECESAMRPIRELADQLTAIVVANKMSEADRVLAWHIAKKQIGHFLDCRRSPESPQVA